MSNEIRRTLGGFLDRDPFGPEDGVCHLWPLGLVAIGGLHESFSDVSVATFDDTVCLRVVGGNSNMINVIFVRKVSHCGDEGGSVVGNDERNGSPAAEDILVDKFSDGASGLGSKHSPFGPA